MRTSATVEVIDDKAQNRRRHLAAARAAGARQAAAPPTPQQAASLKVERPAPPTSTSSDSSHRAVGPEPKEQRPGSRRVNREHGNPDHTERPKLSSPSVNKLARGVVCYDAPLPILPLIMTLALTATDPAATFRAARELATLGAEPVADEPGGGATRARRQRVGARGGAGGAGLGARAVVGGSGARRRHGALSRARAGGGDRAVCARGGAVAVVGDAALRSRSALYQSGRFADAETRYLEAARAPTRAHRARAAPPPTLQQGAAAASASSWLTTARKADLGITHRQVRQRHYEGQDGDESGIVADAPRTISPTSAELGALRAVGLPCSFWLRREPGR